MWQQYSSVSIKCNLSIQFYKSVNLCGEKIHPSCNPRKLPYLKTDKLGTTIIQETSPTAHLLILDGMWQKTGLERERFRPDHAKHLLGAIWDSSRGCNTKTNRRGSGMPTMSFQFKPPFKGELRIRPCKMLQWNRNLPNWFWILRCLINHYCKDEFSGRFTLQTSSSLPCNC